MTGESSAGTAGASDPGAARRFNFVWRSVYHDSVTLMRLTRDLGALPGVDRAAAMMGTPANRALLERAGLLDANGAVATSTDLIIAVTALDEAAARAAEAAASAMLTARPADAGAPGRPRPRTLASALRALPDATLAVISVPGVYAGAEAAKALRAGLHVMLFSDNVPVATEVELKRFAVDRGLFLMGPDCGSALIAGVPIGFANAVPRGRIGIAAASGTGLQEVSCLIAGQGEGVSHAIGVGGRDLTDAVGGLMMTQALAALEADPSTAVIAVIGKSPGPKTVASLTARLGALAKPCVVHFVGPGATDIPAPPAARSLEECARAAVALARGQRPAPVEFTLPPDEIRRLVADAIRGLAPGQRFVRGVYSGGTLAWEALDVLRGAPGEVVADVTGRGDGHRVVDLGEDVYTLGRPHPMIDGTVRRQRILEEAADPTTAVLLIDVVLGHGAHRDPAGELLPALQAARAEAGRRGRALAVVASVTGTDADPQSRAAQVAKLLAHGVVVMPSNAQAARLAVRIAAEAPGAAG